MWKKVLMVGLIVWVINNLYANNYDKTSFKNTLKTKNEKDLKKESQEQKWVDSVFQKLTDDQKLGQLFMVAAYSNKDHGHIKEIEELIKEYNIGGVIFFQGGPVRQALLTNHYQSISKVPLFIGIDAEWGLAMRLDSTVSFPKQMTLGAIQDNQLIYKMGKEIGRECKRLGIHINFAPVVDINSNPGNPVIGNRSFGENKFNVAEKGAAYMKGLQDNKVLANAKHFPGHGDTESDSHQTLPIIKHSSERLAKVELYPFKKLIADSIKSIMVAHLQIPAYDETANTATTLSPKVVSQLLKKEMSYEGLVFTDALNMKAVSKYYKPGEVDLKALLAGNDMLLFSEDVPQAIKQIKQAVKKKKITHSEIEKSVKKILQAKYWAGLNKYEPVDMTNLVPDLNMPKAKVLQQELYENAITLAKNEDSLVPVFKLDTINIASVSIGAPNNNIFQQILSNYAPSVKYSMPNKYASDSLYDELLKKVQNYNVVIVSIHDMNNNVNEGFGISYNAIKFLNSLALQTKVIITVFGNPYSLKYFNNFKNIICTYEDNDITQLVAPQIIFGAIKAKGRLSVSVNETMREGTGITTYTTDRLKYSHPERAGVDSYVLKGIDLVVEEGIRNKAIPGCQVLVAKNGHVIYQKSFGYFSYDSLEKVNNESIYDIASISKVAGTLQAAMFLEERGLINIDKKASEYLPELTKTNKKDITIKEVMTHQGGLLPFIMHWTKTIDIEGLKKEYYRKAPEDLFHIEVAPGVYTIKTIDDSLWKWTIESNLVPKNKKTNIFDYKYSDLSFYILKRIVEKQLNQAMDQFLDQNFFKPLGLGTMSYNPLCKFPESRIAPTELDSTFRKQMIRGVVHDQGAALSGGVAGHAGIFSNANDLAILMQMNLQKGSYGGQRYFFDYTVPKFTERQFPKNRRGLGWDKPAIEGEGPTSPYASTNTFGHTGFTGTAAWVDPDKELVYIFLSNRIHPNANNNKLIQTNIRTRIQEIIYKSIMSYDLFPATIDTP